MHKNIPTYCIHLKERKDREENMYKQLKSFCDNYIIFEGVKDHHGYIGCSKSHRKIIKKAIDNNYDNVLVIEDDIKFTSNKSFDYFQRVLNNLPDKWDIILGGVYYCGNMEKENDYLMKIDNFSSTHFVLYNKNVYKTILRHDVYDKELCHIDRYISHLAKNNLINVYLIYPMIAIQNIGYSDVANKEVDYSKYLSKFKFLND